MSGLADMADGLDPESLSPQDIEALRVLRDRLSEIIGTTEHKNPKGAMGAPLEIVPGVIVRRSADSKRHDYSFLDPDFSQNHVAHSQYGVVLGIGGVSRNDAWVVPADGKFETLHLDSIGHIEAVDWYQGDLNEIQRKHGRAVTPWTSPPVVKVKGPASRKIKAWYDAPRLKKETAPEPEVARDVDISFVNAASIKSSLTSLTQMEDAMRIAQMKMAAKMYGIIFDATKQEPPPKPKKDSLIGKMLGGLSRIFIF